jgi:hypothetical protein
VFIHSVLDLFRGPPITALHACWLSHQVFLGSPDNFVSFTCTLPSVKTRLQVLCELLQTILQQHVCVCHPFLYPCCCRCMSSTSSPQRTLLPWAPCTWLCPHPACPSAPCWHRCSAGPWAAPSHCPCTHCWRCLTRPSCHSCSRCCMQVRVPTLTAAVHTQQLLSV